MKDLSRISKLEDISFDESSLTSSKLCEHWPSGKTALQTLLMVVKNPVVKIVITSIIKLGDGLCSRS